MIVRGEVRSAVVRLVVLLGLITASVALRGSVVDAVVAEHNGYCSSGERCFAFEQGQNTGTATDVGFVGGQYADPSYWEGNMYYRVTYPSLYESPYPLVMARNRHLSSTYRYLCVYSGTWWSGSSMWLDYYSTNWVYTPNGAVPRVRAEQVVRGSDITAYGGCPPVYIS